ncbi:hypothetical protein J2S78_000128 [Salibacterium salarium]|uniref:hypothetical protein n=1 Tax=Salibacterium salarium TaxID=284579 RepID=UPI002789A9B2|nr:hypothetical protein [Salibacterium salarium]MDQ0297720.1 hypothetical protein [Salibacterium salarium]
MPSPIDSINLHQNRPNETPEALDRRVKLTTDDKQAIRDTYFATPEKQRPTMTALAAKHNVDRRLIQFILFPERETRHKKLAQNRQKNGRYYNREKGRKNMQNYRAYKRELIQEKKLDPSLSNKTNKADT